MNTLPTTVPANTPAEVLNISPENLEVANAYLQNPNILAVAEELEITPDLVTQIMARREVKAYIDQIFLNLGFNNRFKLSSLMDTIITKKLQDLDEADAGSTKDISELLALKHKMAMEYIAAEMALEKIRMSSVKTQTNVQINDSSGGGSKYTSLIEKLLASENGVIDV